MSWEALPGWFDFDATYREWVRDTPRDGTIIEIGVCFGRSLAFLAHEAIEQKRDDLTIVGVDPFEIEDWMARDCSEILAGRTLRETFESLMVEHAPRERGRVWVRQRTSLVEAALRSEYAAPVDRVYIDGDHSTEAVTADIAAWLPLVKPGGVIGGHDYGNFGVEPAVRAAFGEDFELRGSTWLHRVKL